MANDPTTHLRAIGGVAVSATYLEAATSTLLETLIDSGVGDLSYGQPFETVLERCAIVLQRYPQEDASGPCGSLHAVAPPASRSSATSSRLFRRVAA